MSFGKSAGPPASRRQIETLTELVHAAGHLDFRDAVVRSASTSARPADGSPEMKPTS